ncbi:PE-PGRS family protein [Mycobacterium asiaticum]|uniref:PE-PGRS family protein n=1 Tax=Mycobacterium asiaticum TaxID=1790 RepID=A0A1A3P356_MYCAS|nr:PE family protein [Mycobacterium asiaticum]OBK28611.1 PE-PGRS family protein [Mycobacterium asiaticum]
MSYVITAPEALAAAAKDLTGIGDVLKRAAAGAAPSTTTIVTAAGDEISAAVARLFGNYAEEFQALTAQTSLFQTQFEQALSAAGAAYAAAEAANVAPLQALLQQVEGSGFFAPVEQLIGRPLFGGAWAGPLGRYGATLSALLNAATNAVGLGGVVNFPSTVALSAPTTNGVTGVKIGFSFLQIPLGQASFLGIPLGPISYPAPTLWYSPVQATGAVSPTHVTYLQHGFGAFGWLYQPLALQMSQQTNSVIATPTIPSIPLPLGIWLNSPEMQQGVGSLFLGSQPALNLSAHQAGFTGTLPQDFILSGHSAGGGLTSIAGGNYLAALGTGTNHLRGVVMFDGVANNATAFGAAVTNLQAANVPIYVVAAPPQPWNASGVTTSQLASLYPNQFSGVTLVNGSHVDSMLGNGPVIDLVLQLVTGFSPPGNTAAVYTLSNGWINDIFGGGTPAAPIYGIYGPAPLNEYVAPGGQQITLGQASGIVLR